MHNNCFKKNDCLRFSLSSFFHRTLIQFPKQFFITITQLIVVTLSSENVSSKRLIVSGKLFFTSLFTVNLPILFEAKEEDVDYV